MSWTVKLREIRIRGCLFEQEWSISSCLALSVDHTRNKLSALRSWIGTEPKSDKNIKSVTENERELVDHLRHQKTEEAIGAEGIEGPCSNERRWMDHARLSEQFSKQFITSARSPHNSNFSRCTIQSLEEAQNRFDSGLTGSRNVCSLILVFSPSARLPLPFPRCSSQWMQMTRTR